MGPDPLMSLSMSQSASGVNVASDTAYPSHIGFDEPRAEPVLYASGISSSGPVGEGNSTASTLLLHPTSGPGFDNTGAAPLDDHLDASFTPKFPSLPAAAATRNAAQSSQAVELPHERYKSQHSHKTLETKSLPRAEHEGPGSMRLAALEPTTLRANTHLAWLQVLNSLPIETLYEPFCMDAVNAVPGGRTCTVPVIVTPCVACAPHHILTACCLCRHHVTAMKKQRCRRSHPRRPTVWQTAQTAARAMWSAAAMVELDCTPSVDGNLIFLFTCCAQVGSWEL